MRAAKIYFSVLLIVSFQNAYGGFFDYVKTVGSSLGFHSDDDPSEYENESALEGFNNKIPYEVSLTDEKFIAEAIKLTGVAVSELDTCQHRVVLKLHTDCHSMNDETISKMAVALLNCQSHIENRKIYPCNQEMSLKDCTKDMDQIAWNSYLLMSNRARAVCYSVRQAQFRGLTEHTINKLMNAAKNQLSTLSQIAEDQENIQGIAKSTLQSVTSGQQELVEQQKNLQKAQFIGQLAIESNINRLGEEKKLIMDSQRELAAMTSSMKTKLEEASEQLQNQAMESSDNHNALLKDLYEIQDKANNIFQRIEDSSKLLIKQSELAQEQYQSTINQLTEVNATVHALVSLVGGTKQAMEDRLSWIVEHLGGTDEALDRVYIILWHVSFLLTGMIACAFLAARTTTRLVVISMIPANMGMSLYQQEHALDAKTLALSLALYIGVQTCFVTVHKMIRTRKFPPSNMKSLEVNENRKNNCDSSTPLNISERDACKYKPSPVSRQFEDVVDNYEESRRRTHAYEENDREDDFDEYISPTPPLSRNGHYNLFNRSRSQTPISKSSLTANRISCKANTRLGTPCKISSLPGRDYCYRHQKGDSVMG